MAERLAIGIRQRDHAIVGTHAAVIGRQPSAFRNAEQICRIGLPFVEPGSDAPPVWKGNLDAPTRVEVRAATVGRTPFIAVERVENCGLVVEQLPELTEDAVSTVTISVDRDGCRTGPSTIEATGYAHFAAEPAVFLDQLALGPTEERS